AARPDGAEDRPGVLARLVVAGVAAERALVARMAVGDAEDHRLARAHRDAQGPGAGAAVHAGEADAGVHVEAALVDAAEERELAHLRLPADGEALGQRAHVALARADGGLG